MQNRNLYINIWNDLSEDKHMIFLVGPRQVGKTTLAHFISESFSNRLYFNWDIHENRVHFIQDPYFFETVERKVYLVNTPRIKDAGARFENMVALELWRAVTGWNDMGYGTFSLHFIKNKEQQEVDFLIAKDREPFLLVESKLSDTQPSPSLRKFQSALRKPALQLIRDGESFRLVPNGDQLILIAPAYHWLSGLP